MTKNHFMLASALVALTLAALPGEAVADSPFRGLDGTWRGGGQVRLAGGQTERLSCKAYYNAKDSGEGLGIALSCASASNKIELRANLVYAGGKVSGDWEERAFNSSGVVTGKAADGNIDLSISGTLQAQMSISMDSGSQSVSISTDGTGFKSVDLQLKRI